MSFSVGDQVEIIVGDSDEVDGIIVSEVGQRDDASTSDRYFNVRYTAENGEEKTTIRAGRYITDPNRIISSGTEPEPDLTPSDILFQAIHPISLLCMAGIWFTSGFIFYHNWLGPGANYPTWIIAMKSIILGLIVFHSVVFTSIIFSLPALGAGAPQPTESPVDPDVWLYINIGLLLLCWLLLFILNMIEMRRQPRRQGQAQAGGSRTKRRKSHTSHKSR